MTQSPPDPRDARTAEEYVARARRLKAWSGYSYRELSRRAAAAGEHLPPSTLATALRRASLPGERLIAAFVRACGCEPATVEEWIAVRRRIAMEAEDAAVPPSPKSPKTPAAVPAPAELTPPVPVRGAPPKRGMSPGGRPWGRGRGRRLRLAGLLAIGVVTLVCAVGGQPRPRPAASGSPRPAGPLVNGWYRIHLAFDGRCLGVTGSAAGLTSDPPVRGQDCRHGTGQRFYFEYADGGAYRIKAVRPAGGFGCLTADAVPDAARTAGGGLRLRACAPADPGQLLRLEAVPGQRRHDWLPSRLWLRAATGRTVRVAGAGPGPGGDEAGFYLTGLERPTGPSGRGRRQDP